MHDTNLSENTYKNRHVSRFIAILSVYSCLLKEEPFSNLRKNYKTLVKSYNTKDIFIPEYIDSKFDDLTLVNPDEDFLEKLLNTLTENEDAVRTLINKSLNDRWNYSRLDKVICSILKLGCTELLYNGEIPSNIIIDEYVSLTKTFYSNSEAGFVNKVLDVSAINARSK